MDDKEKKEKIDPSGGLGRWGSLAGLGLGESERLRSIRMNPDLSLGAKKKEFKPNLANIQPRPKKEGEEAAPTKPRENKPKKTFEKPKWKPSFTSTPAAAPVPSLAPPMVGAFKKAPILTKPVTSGKPEKEKKKKEKHVNTDPNAPTRFPFDIPQEASIPLFNFDGTTLQRNQLFMMQMPTDIPIDPPSHVKSGEFQSTLVGEHLNGRLGQIIVYESGVVKLRVGDVLFDITQTQPISFEQEVCVIDDDEKACIRIAPLAQRLVCTPDLEHLLERRLNTIHVQGGLTQSEN